MSNQSVGEFIDIPPFKQQQVIEAFSNVMAADQKINTMNVYGYADATRVTELGAQRVQEKFAGLRKILLDK